MTIQEAHIDFITKLRENASYAYGDWRPEEIDSLLYEHQLRFIRDVLNNRPNSLGGFQDYQGRTDEIQNLIRSRSLPAYYEDDRYYLTYLPGDYFALIEDSSQVCKTCNSVSGLAGTKDLQFSYIAIDEAATYTKFNVTITFNDGSPAIAFVMTDFISSVSPDLHYQLKNLLMDIDGKGQVDFYYEGFSNVAYQQNSIVVVSRNENVDTITVTVNTGGGDVAEVLVLSSVNFDIRTATKPTAWVTNRLTPSDLEGLMSGNPLAKTRKIAPLSFIESDRLVVRHDNLFDVYSFKLKYIKKPRRVSLAANIGFEVGATRADDIHRRIVDLAVETAAMRGQNANVQLIAASNAKSD